MVIIKPEIFSNTQIKSIQTTRVGGTSQKLYSSLNLGVFGQDAQVASNIKHLAQAQKLPHNPIFMQQLHGNLVAEYVIPPKKHGAVQADACFTMQPNIICAILTADCLPVLIADKNATIVAAVHCGWRGLLAEILQATIRKMDKNPQELECWLGPCISYKPYRVNAEFREQFVKQDKEYAHSFYLSQKGSWHADLKKIAAYQLKSLGVQEIMQSPYCTHTNKNLFYSYRRDGETGRMASMIWLADN